MAGLYHNFLLLDREHDGEWAASRFIHDPRGIHLHDNFLRYLWDTLVWIPTTNPSGGEHTGLGLCLWGSTLIEVEGATIAERVFAGWAELLAVGPPLLNLTGDYTWVSDVDDPRSEEGGKATQLDGGYDRLLVDREKAVGILRQLAGWCRQVATGKGRLYVLHEGI